MFIRGSLGLAVALVVSVVLAIGLGPAPVSPADTLRYLAAALTGGTIGLDELATYEIVWQLRTPRVLLAAVVGAGLSAVGVGVQALVRNPLADPFVLGISSGAAVGAVSVLVTGALAVAGILRCRSARSPAHWSPPCWCTWPPGAGGPAGRAHCAWC